VNLVNVALHEFGHGLGFLIAPTDLATGERLDGLASVWEEFVFDMTTRKRWLDMNNAERAASAVNSDNVVWAGPRTTLYANTVLDFRNELVVYSPRSTMGIFEARLATFGPKLNYTGITDSVVPAVDLGGVSAIDGCEPFAAAPSVRGKIALVDRGTCLFAVKVKNAQLAGASGVIVVNNVAAGLPTMAGVDDTITSPSIGVRKAVGDAIRTAWLAEPLRDPVRATMHLSFLIRQGTNNGLVRLSAPNPLIPAHSIVHWDNSLSPAQLMHDTLSLTRQTFAVKPPGDLTLALLQDIGW
jgi:hypothetical protein